MFTGDSEKAHALKVRHLFQQGKFVNTSEWLSFVQSKKDLGRLRRTLYVRLGTGIFLCSLKELISGRFWVNFHCDSWTVDNFFPELPRFLTRIRKRKIRIVNEPNKSIIHTLLYVQTMSENLNFNSENIFSLWHFVAGFIFACILKIFIIH